MTERDWTEVRWVLNIPKTQGWISDNYFQPKPWACNVKRWDSESKNVKGNEGGNNRWEENFLTAVKGMKTKRESDQNQNRRNKNVLSIWKRDAISVYCSSLFVFYMCHLFDSFQQVFLVSPYFELKFPVNDKPGIRKWERLQSCDLLAIPLPNANCLRVWIHHIFEVPICNEIKWKTFSSLIKPCGNNTSIHFIAAGQPC